MENGNIMDFVGKNQDYNRVDLVSEVGVISFCRLTDWIARWRSYWLAISTRTKHRPR